VLLEPVCSAHANQTWHLGVQLMLKKQNSGVDQHLYLRCAEEHTLSDGKVYRLVICMTPAMSHQLIAALFISIDTSFKRIKAWQEFEMETWDPNRKKRKDILSDM